MGRTAADARRAGPRPFLRLLLDAGYLPVVAPLAASHEGVAVNVDGDRAAAAIGIALGWAEGRMKKKVLGAAAAVAGGVGRAVLADGRVASPLLQALAGRGTVVT